MAHPKLVFNLKQVFVITFFNKAGSDQKLYRHRSICIIKVYCVNSNHAHISFFTYSRFHLPLLSRHWTGEKKQFRIVVGLFSMAFIDSGNGWSSLK